MRQNKTEIPLLYALPRPAATPARSSTIRLAATGPMAYGHPIDRTAVSSYPSSGLRGVGDTTCPDEVRGRAREGTTLGGAEP